MLTDFAMPGMTGLRLAEEILQIRPGIPVILGTGFATALDREAALDAGLRGVILKPYSVQSLGTALRAALDGTTIPFEMPAGA